MLDSKSVFSAELFLASFDSFSRVLMASTGSQMIPDASRLGVGVFYTILELFHDPSVGVDAQNSSKKF